MDIAYSVKDRCYYGYTTVYEPSFVQVMAIYFKSSDSVILDDVQIQFLFMRTPTTNYSMGVSLSSEFYYNHFDLKLYAMMEISHNLLLGNKYEMNDHIHNQFFENPNNPNESANLYTYQLNKTKD